MCACACVCVCVCVCACVCVCVCVCVCLQVELLDCEFVVPKASWCVCRSDTHTRPLHEQTRARARTRRASPTPARADAQYIGRARTRRAHPTPARADAQYIGRARTRRAHPTPARADAQYIGRARTEQRRGRARGEEAKDASPAQYHRHDVVLQAFPRVASFPLVGLARAVYLLFSSAGPQTM